MSSVYLGGFRGMSWQKWNLLFMIMFSLVYDHLKLRKFVCFLATVGAGPLPQSPPFCTAGFVQAKTLAHLLAATLGPPSHLDEVGESRNVQLVTDFNHPPTCQ